MLDIKLLRQNLKTVADNLAARGFVLDSDYFNGSEEERKSTQIQVETLQAQRNQLAKKIAALKSGSVQDRAHETVEDLIQQSQELNAELADLMQTLENLQRQLEDFLSRIPNLLHESVPFGKTEADNREIRRVGEPPAWHFEPKDHVDLSTLSAQRLQKGSKVGHRGQLNFTTAAQLSGSRFVLLEGFFAKLHRALAQYMLDLHTTRHGYTEVNVPVLIRASCLHGTGQLPHLKEDLFKIENKDLWLIPTSEVPLANMVQGQLLDPQDFPLKFVCHSNCFRAEAGTYGKDTRGMLRQHQFEKVELVQIVQPQDSYAALEEMLGHAEAVLQGLELPYRVVELCSGDIGFAAAKTYDLEVWLPGQQCYREISSCSNTEAFQARRMQTRYRDPISKKTEWVHTLNASGLAVGRTLIAVMENYQDEEGNIQIPRVLKKYFNDPEGMTT